MQLFFTGSVYIPKRSLFICSASKIMLFLSGLIPRVSGFPRNWTLAGLIVRRYETLTSSQASKIHQRPRESEVQLRDS